MASRQALTEIFSLSCNISSIGRPVAWAICSTVPTPILRKFSAASMAFWDELYPLSRTHKKKGLKNPKKIFKYQLDFLSLEDRYQ